MQHLGATRSMPSLWTQMPRFFMYPLRLNGVLFLALLALLTIASVKLIDRSSIFVLLPIFIIGSLAIRQGLRVIEFCSQGRARPPSVVELFDGKPATLKMLGLMLAYGMAVGALSRFGMVGLAAIVGVSLLLPASIMTLAIHGSLRQAIEPFGVIILAARTGWSYLGLVLLLVMTAQGPQQAIALLPPATLKHLAENSPHLLAALLIVSTAYFNMVMGAMMGYLLFVHHDELGIRPDEPQFQERADHRALELARAVILVREARYDDALRQMGGMVADYPKDVQVLEYHHKLLCESGAEPDRVVQHTERYLQTLIDTQRRGRLVAVLEAARRVVPQYQPKSIAVRRAVAEEYFLQRQCKPAIALIAMLHKEAPASDELPATYFLLARIYSEGVRDDGKAIMILDYVLQHFPGHAMAADIARYRAVVLSLAQTGQAGACATV